MINTGLLYVRSFITLGLIYLAKKVCVHGFTHDDLVSAFNHEATMLDQYPVVSQFEFTGQ